MSVDFLLCEYLLYFLLGVECGVVVVDESAWAEAGVKVVLNDGVVFGVVVHEGQVEVVDLGREVVVGEGLGCFSVFLEEGEFDFGSDGELWFRGRFWFGEFCCFSLLLEGWRKLYFGD